MELLAILAPVSVAVTLLDPDSTALNEGSHIYDTNQGVRSAVWKLLWNLPASNTKTMTIKIK